MTDAQLDTLVRTLKALADESRIRILGLLATEDRSVDELALALGLRSPTVSHHLARLREAGLVTMRVEGNAHIHALDRSRLQALGPELFAPGALAGLATEPSTEALERHVLYHYFEGERIKEIPASRKKRDVLLRWLADRFEHDARYPERRVNEIIGRHHPDFATLRRELVGARLMAREDGVYWRLQQEPV